MSGQESEHKLGLHQGFTYAAPFLVANFLYFPAQMLLAGMYAKYFGLALTTIATVVFAARLFDAVTDPLIGYLSDRYQVRNGTRKPWIMVGGVGLVVSSYFLYVPPDPVSIPYFVGWYFAFYLAWTILDIPHIAWGGELTACSHEKTRVYSLRFAMFFLGALLFSIVPLLPFFKSEGFTPETLKWSVLASGILMLPLLLLCTVVTPNGRNSLRSVKETPQLLLKSVIANQPLLLLLAGFFLISISMGLYLGLSFIFAEAYLGVGGKLPIIFAISELVGLAGTLAIYYLSSRIEKVTLYRLAVIISALAMVGHALLMPGLASVIPFMLLTSVVFLGNAMIIIIVPSLLSDIADYGLWKFGVNRAATYFAVYAFMAKAIVGIAGALGLGLVGWYGFDAASASHAREHVFGLRLTMAYLPAILMLLALTLIAKTPINAQRHSIIQQRLSQRMQRSDQTQVTDTVSAPILPKAIPIIEQY